MVSLLEGRKLRPQRYINELDEICRRQIQGATPVTSPMTDFRLRTMFLSANASNGCHMSSPTQLL